MRVRWARWGDEIEITKLLLTRPALLGLNVGVLQTLTVIITPVPRLGLFLSLQFLA